MKLTKNRIQAISLVIAIGFVWFSFLLEQQTVNWILTLILGGNAVVEWFA